MDNSTKDAIDLVSAIAGIVVCFFVVIDFTFNRWRYIKRSVIWVSKQVMKLKPNSDIVSLDIPPTPPTNILTVESADGSSKTMVKYIMYGEERLLAYTTTREAFPGTRFLVERNHPNKPPQSIQTPNRDEANAKWNEWYKEWQQNGFGGASGTGLSGEPPF